MLAINLIKRIQSLSGDLMKFSGNADNTDKSILQPSTTTTTYMEINNGIKEGHGFSTDI